MLGSGLEEKKKLPMRESGTKIELGVCVYVKKVERLGEKEIAVEL